MSTWTPMEHLPGMRSPGATRHVPGMGNVEVMETSSGAIATLLVRTPDGVARERLVPAPLLDLRAAKQHVDQMLDDPTVHQHITEYLDTIYPNRDKD